MISIIISLILSLSPQPDCLELDIMLVGDYSGSIKGNEQFIAEAFTSFSSQFKLSETGINIGVVTFGSDAYLVSPLTSSQETLDSGLDIMSRMVCDGSTNMISALQLASIQLSKGRPNVQDVIIIVSDGYPDHATETITIAEQIKQLQHVMICTILVNGTSIDEKMLQDLSSNCYVRSDYLQLSNEIKELDLCL